MAYGLNAPLAEFPAGLVDCWRVEVRINGGLAGLADDNSGETLNAGVAGVAGGTAMSGLWMACVGGAYKELHDDGK